MRAVAVLVASLLGLFACGDNVRGNIALVVDEQFAPVFDDFVAYGGHRGLVLRESPGAIATIRVAFDAAMPREGYRVEKVGTTYQVQASDVLGAQYGAAAALEALGVRYRHPLDPYVPGTFELGDVAPDVHQPQIRVRGFQLHTLHPIEGYFAFWEPTSGTVYGKRIIDWLVKNRGNFLQWVALDDIITDPARHTAWLAHTKELVDYAHFRGIRVGLNIQLFGQSNLQQAFDLSDDTTGTVPLADEIAARLPLITDGVTFDTYVLSFGEFFNSDADKFVAALNEVQAQLAARVPTAELQGFIHVGDDQRIDYMGENLIYYFLVKFAHPAIVPAVHTVMFYNLYEPAHGAYHHEDFAEHAAYLEQRICEGKPAAYIPETAYWVAFDVSIPQFYPLYIRSRWLDLAKLKERVGACGPLDNHTVFQTAWEWGYWLNDTTVMRASYELPSSYESLIETELAPDLAAAAPLVARLAELQHEYLMDKELAPYLASRDASIDAGRLLGIISQPNNVTFDDLAKGADRAAFRTNVMEPLAAYADALEGLAAEVDDLALPDSRWTAELRAGFRIDAVRARYAIATYSATLAHLDGDTDGLATHHTEAQRRFDEAQAIVKARHADLHDTHGRRLVDRTPNRTLYEYGYLYMPETMCFWRRELIEVERVTMGSTEPVPDCLFK